MPSDWYVVIDGNSCGPLDDSGIKALVQEGRITPETLVCRAGMKEWVAAQRIKGLFPASQASIASQRHQSAQHVSMAPAARPATTSAQAESPLPAIQIGSPASRFGYTANADRSINILLGIGGACALLLGFFCPILRLPIIGSMSYLSFIGLLVREGAVSEMTVSAFFVIAAIGIAVLVAVVKQPLMFWVPGLSGCLATLLTIGKYFWLQGEMATKMKQDLEGNPFAGLAQAMAQSVSLDFGIGIIALGSALIIAGAVVPAGNRR